MPLLEISKCQFSPALFYTSTRKIPTLYTASLKKVPLSGGASLCSPLQGVPSPGFHVRGRMAIIPSLSASPATAPTNTEASGLGGNPWLPPSVWKKKYFKNDYWRMKMFFKRNGKQPWQSLKFPNCERRGHCDCFGKMNEKNVWVECWK